MLQHVYSCPIPVLLSLTDSRFRRWKLPGAAENSCCFEVLPRLATGGAELFGPHLPQPGRYFEGLEFQCAPGETNHHWFTVSEC